MNPQDQSNQLPSLGIPTVDDALDWVWLADIGQGNFCLARGVVEQVLAEKRDADTLFARAVIHQLQGEYAKAFPLFEEAFAKTSDVVTQFIIASMARLIERKRGDVLPDGVSQILIEAELRWGKIIELTQWEQRWERLDHQLREASSSAFGLLVGNFIHNICSMMPTYRSIVLDAKNFVGTQVNPLVMFQKTFTELFENSEKLNATLLVGILHTCWIELCALNGQFDLAISLVKQLFDAYQEVGNPLWMGWYRLCQGDLQAAPLPLGHPLLVGYRLSEQMTDTTVTFEAKQLDRSIIDVSSARSVYIDAQQYFTTANAPRGQAMAMLRLAYLDAIEASWESAFEKYTSACLSFEGIGDFLNLWTATAYKIWAGVHCNMPQSNLVAQARTIAQKAYQNDALACGLGLGLMFAYIGRDALESKGDVEIALCAAKIAQAIFAEFHAPLREAQVCADRAEAFASIEAVDSSLNEREAALNLLEKAFEQGGTTKQSLRFKVIQQAFNLVSLAARQFDSERLERTLELVRDLIAESASIQDHADVPSIMSNGESTFSEDGLSIIESETYKLIESDVAFFAPFGRGVKAMEAGNGAVAERNFTKALESLKGCPEIDFRSAMVFAAWRKYSEAQAALQSYLAEGMPRSTAQMQSILYRVAPGQSVEEKRKEQLSIHSELLSLFVAIKDWQSVQRELDEIERLREGTFSLSPLSTKEEILNYSYYGLLAESTNNYELAKQYLIEAINAMENRRRLLRQESLRRAFGSQRPIIGLYGDLTRVLVDSGNWYEAFRIAERARARVLSETLSGAKAAAKNLESNSTFQQYTEQAVAVEKLTTLLNLVRWKGTTQIAELEQQLQESINKLSNYEDTLSRTEPRWRELFLPQAETLSLNEVASSLSADTLMLAYFFSGEHLHAWAISCNGLIGQHGLDQIDGKEFISRPFGARLINWIEDLNRGNIDSIFSALLSQSLIEPFDAYIDTAQHLLIVPFAELNMFPFGALPWRGEPLGLQKSISYLPAASLLQYFRDSDSTATEELVVGNPEAMSYKPHSDVGSDVTVPLHPLPAARAGAQLVAQLYGVQPLLGAQATEETVRGEIKRYPRMIHFFTHGYLQPLVPLDSGIALAHGKALTVDELMGLGLRADIVFLSACNTGQGKLYGSELVGLARSILYAGARAIVVSLWEADDVANAMLMYLLHQKLLGGASLGAALRASQEQLRNSTAQQVLDFCQLAQSYISQETESDRLDYAIFIQCIGNILAEGGDYSGALSKFDLAVPSIVSLGYSDIAESLRQSENYRRSKLSVSRRRVSKFDPEKKIFDSPKYWAPFEILGDWR